MSDLESIVSDTAKAMKKCIQKPPMTDKLLKKPPFRFLHDIVTELIKTHGFLDGLYSAEEKDSDNVKDKASKIDFLEKAINATMFVVGKNLSARPSKIVAGHEPEHTNIWLQAMAYAVRKKMDTSEAVTRVLNGEKPKKKSRSKDKEKESAHASEDKPHRGSKGSRDDQPKGSASRSSAKARKDSQKSSSSSREERSRTRSGKRLPQPPESQPEPEPEPEPAPEPEPQVVQQEPSEPTAAAPEELERPSSSRGHRRHEDAPNNDVYDPRGPRQNQDEDEDESNMMMDSSRPAPSEEDALPDSVVKSIRRVERPSTARLAPPKRKRDGGSAGVPTSATGRGPEESVQVITDADVEDDDDDEYIVEEDSQPVMQVESKEDDQEEGERGALMRKIMAKKELGDDSGDVTVRVASAQRRKIQEQTEKEVNALQQAIQKLSRSAHPLGKVVDHIQEDIDSMKKELLHWQNEHETYSQMLEDNMSTQKNELLPLETQLGDLEQQVKDGEEMIASLKQMVLDNESKIQNLLLSIGLAA